MHCCSHKEEPSGAEIKRLNHQLQGINVSHLHWTSNIFVVCACFLLQKRLYIFVAFCVKLQQVTTVGYHKL